MADRLAFFSSIQQVLAGNISRATLLTKLLPLSFISLLSTLIIAAQFFPEEYDLRMRVISHLISPRYNPEGYLISSIGMAVAAFLALPFAGYVEGRLRGISPRMSRWSGVALGLGILLVVSVTLPLNVPSLPSIRWLHEALARTATVAIIGGMICCCLCGLKDRFELFGGRQSLSRLLVLIWASLTLLPIGCGVIAAIFKLAHKAKFEWVEQPRFFLRQTMLWQLAFWEWVGVAGFILFMLVSVILLPARATSEPCLRRGNAAGKGSS